MSCHYGHVVHVSHDLELPLSFHVCLNGFLSREKEHLFILVSYGLEFPLY